MRHERVKLDIAADETPLLHRPTAEASMSQADDGINSLQRDQGARVFSNSDKAGMLIPEDALSGPQLKKNPTWQKSSQIWQIFKRLITDLIRRIHSFFRSNHPDAAITGLYVPPFKLYGGLSKSIMENQALDPKIDLFMDTISKDPPKIDSYVQASARQKWSPKDLRDQLKQSFNRMHGILDQEKSDQVLTELSNLLSKNIGSVLRSGSAEPDLDPVVVLGRNLAPYNSEALAKDQEILQKHLLKEEQQYLSRILGLLGPSNVLEPYIKAALQDKHVFEKVNSAGRVIPVDPDSFFEKLKLIHNELSKLASCQPLPDLSKQTKKPSILNLKSPGGTYKTSENIHLPLDSHDPLELLQILAPQASKRLATASQHSPATISTPSPSAAASLPDHHRRRSKGRARTRASGVKIIDDPMQDEKRLKDQLTQMGFYAVNTLGDGNCLFRALSDQLYGTPNRHLEIRQQVCLYLAQHESRYKAFVDMDEEESWESHLQLMAKQGTYGGHLELSAFANFHRRPIKIIQPGMVYVISYEDESPSGSSANKAKGKQLLVAKGKGKRPDDSASAVSSSETPVYLVYHQWEHYSSVRNLDGPHSGIPNIRERDMESTVGLSQNEPQKDEHDGCGTDAVSPGGKRRKASMMSYRESTSSPASAGSCSTTTTTTDTTVSSSGSGSSSSKGPSVDSTTARQAEEEEEEEAGGRSSGSPSHAPSSLHPSTRPSRTRKAGSNVRITPFSRPLPPPPPSDSSSLQDTKPLSKRALRLARRNRLLPAHPRDSPSSSALNNPAAARNLDSVGLLRELKV
ncbi:hypothetical protein PCANC_06636 [Puccinia coronata f. sp. avenae]|uniref:OTU domain-containing protein n=1 Tax=Puccinia coronata f. sp. avenae TaxID=200324 RepID=A0A2N5T009_9BASI|nr:hypothetical protein PCANC_06636 [Puccinia coronata f. sp. avenae]